MTTQLTLDLVPGITDRYGSLLEAVAAGVYARGLKRCAGDLDKAPGNLSRELAGDSDRHFSVEALERYIHTSGDLTPVHYLVARYLGDQAAAQDATARRIEALLSEVVALTGAKKPAARR